jgi:hypothetical protein
MTVITTARNLARHKKQLALRQKLWPEAQSAELWNRKRNDGFVTVPRTMPLVLRIIDELAKGLRPSPVYLELWSRVFDEGFVTLSKAEEMAFGSGYYGQRAVLTWRKRIETLRDLGFIQVASGPSGPLSYALIMNPHLVIKEHKKKKSVGFCEDSFHALLARGLEVGADDLISAEEAVE